MTVTRRNTIRNRGKVRVPIDQDVKELIDQDVKEVIEAGHNGCDCEVDLEQLARLIQRILEIGCVQGQIPLKSC